MSGSERLFKLDLGCRPEGAVSGAVVVQTERSTFLTFNAMREGPDGLYKDVGTAVVEFLWCTISKFGYPNDEAWWEIPRTRGLTDGAYEVLDSGWNEEIARLNRYAFPDTHSWPGRHFLFLFRDSSFECLARDLRVEIVDRPYAEVFQRIADRVLAE